MNSIVPIAAVLLLAVATCTGDYCNLESCKRKGPHTMCTYSAKLSPTCGKRVVTVGLSQAEKDEIVKTHNDLRKYVASGQEKRGAPGPQPAAKDMNQLTWDNELAVIAQRWANQCNFNHDKCRDIPQYQVGQNVGSRSVKGKRNTYTPSVIIQRWYDEVDQFDGRKASTGISDYNKVGHYTQVVWASTKKIGCGRVTYFDDDGWEKLFLVCNYGPSGNWFKAPLYATK